MTMKEKDFIIKTLNEWCDQFEGIHVRYAYDVNSEYHIVEVDPESIRRGNDLYKQAELSFWIAFMSNFPESDLLVCEPSESNNMDNCLFEYPQNNHCYSEWEIYLADSYKVLTEVTTLSRRSSYSKFNEYNNNNEYSLAA